MMSSRAARAILSLQAKRGSLVIVAAILFGALALMGLFLAPKPAHACLCAPSGSPAEALERADTVFAGKVTSIKFKGTSPYRLSTADPVEVEFRVSRVWKGPLRETTAVETENSGISCGYQFKKGQTYIVYATDGYTGMCSRTAPAWRAFADLMALGPGRQPEVTPGNETSGGGACAAAADTDDNPMDIAVLTLLASAVALGIRRRPRL